MRLGISRDILLKGKGVAGVDLPDFFTGIRSHDSESGKWLVKVDTIDIVFLTDCFK